MLITRECDYAVRVVRALEGGARLSVNEICEKEDITVPFAYKILKKLQEADIVKGYRGVHGGYILNRRAAELTLLDVYRAIDPELFIIDCVNPKRCCSRDLGDERACRVHRELAAIQQELVGMLRRKSLEEIFGGEEAENNS